MVQTKAEVVKLLAEHQAEIHRFAVLRLGLFGSFAKETNGPESDVDLLVEFEPEGKTFRNFIGLVFFLEDLLHRKVELVTPESISPYMRDEILKEAEHVLA